MDSEHPLAHELARLDEKIGDLEAELSRTPADDPLNLGDRLELATMQQQRALVQDMITMGDDLSAALASCHSRLREVEGKHQRMITSGRARDLRHDDEWWETEDQMTYLADLARQIGAAIASHST